MKNLQIGDNDLIGNRFNGHDLHRYLRQRGVDSDHLVRSKQSHDPDTYILAEEVRDRYACNDMIQSAEQYYSTHSLHYPFSYSLFRNRLFLDADVVHYHLIQNYFFNLSLLPALTALKPSVWTIHDPWIMTGHCIHPFDCDRWKTGCGNCPNLGTNYAFEHDTTALNWEIKRNILNNSQIDLVVASKFMYDMVKQSPLISHLDVHHIPFGIDLNRFTPCDGRDARKKLGIPQGSIVVSFRADPSQFKGFEYAKQCL
jgi:glycosyltransferase involved in cell wall biosynthesis